MKVIHLFDLSFYYPHNMNNVKIYINNLVDTKKLNQGYIVYNKEKELNNTMDYIDLRFEFISVK